MCSHNKFKIQIADKSNINEIINIVKRSFVQYCDSIGINSIEALQEGKEEVLNDLQYKHIYIAFWDQAIVGTIRIELKEERAIISRFAVLPECQSLGIGSKMLSYVETLLVSKHIELVELYSAVENIRLKKFYISRGYQIISTNNSSGYQRGLFQKKL